MRIYVAGPLSGGPAGRTSSKVVVDYIQNIRQMCQVATYLRRQGHHPYIPAADIVVGIATGLWHEDDYRDTSLAFLDVCDAVFVCGMSTGVKRELDHWADRGPVYYDISLVPRI